MTLPTTRFYTQASSAPIQAALLNLLQDSIIGRKFPSSEQWQLPGIGISCTNATAAAPYGATGTTNTGSSFSPDIPVICPIPGTRITGIKALALLATSSSFGRWALCRGNIGNLSAIASPTAMQTFTTATGVAAAQIYSFTLTTPYTVLTGDYFSMQISFAGTGSVLGPFALVTDRL